jgi:hypothetical protein
MDAGDGSVIYIDKAISTTAPNQSLDTILSFYRFYSELFGALNADAPFVLLRNAEYDGSMILNGVGARGGAISADLKLADECQTLSTTLFHLYFDSKIKAPNLRFQPNNWIYMGLSNYCVLESASYLSDEIKEAYSINITFDREINYLKYLYFSLKEPGFLVVNPSMEGGMPIAQEEYYFSVKVPLMLDLVNTVIANNGGGGLIKALLSVSGSDTSSGIDLDLTDFLKTECGDEYDAILKYFSGTALIPNFNNYNIDDKLTSEEIVAELLADEDYYSVLFNNDYIHYEYPPMFMLDPGKFFPAAEAMGVRYNTEEVQAHVESFSKTLHQLLMQYAVLAKLAGVDDITVPKATEGMYTQEIFDRWTEFCKDCGYDFDINDFYVD